jgi:hypothetical protein
LLATQAFVVSHVGGLRWEYVQVFGSVIGSVSVNVVNDLSWQQWAAQLFFGHFAVDGNISTSPHIPLGAKASLTVSFARLERHKRVPVLGKPQPVHVAETFLPNGLVTTLDRAQSDHDSASSIP